MKTDYKEKFTGHNLLSLSSFARNEREYGGIFLSITFPLSKFDDSNTISSFCSDELERLIEKYGYEKVDFLETWGETVDFMTSKVLEEQENGNREDVFST